jgi:hypothetical protein
MLRLLNCSVPLWLVGFWANKTEQSQVTRAFDGQGDPALVLGAQAGLAPWPDPAVVAHEPAQCINCLVIDGNVLAAKGAKTRFAGSPAKSSLF